MSLPGSLDTQRTREVLALLRDLCIQRGMVLVLATHDPQAAAFANQVTSCATGAWAGTCRTSAERLDAPRRVRVA